MIKRLRIFWEYLFAPWDEEGYIDLKTAWKVSGTIFESQELCNRHKKNH